VIPLDKAKRSRAMQLLAKTKDMMGLNDSIVLSQNSNTDTTILEAKFDTMIQLMTQLLQKDTNVYMDSRKVTKEVDRTRTNQQDIDRRRLGLI